MSLASHSALMGAFLSLTASAQFVLTEDIGRNGVDDGAFTPDGQYLVLRDNTVNTDAIVLDAHTGAVLFDQPVSALGISGHCLDAVEATNERAVVLGSETMIIDLTTMTPVAVHETGFRPRDVAITPDGTIAAVRGGNTTGTLLGGLYLFDLISGNQIGFAPGEPSIYDSDRYSFDVDSVVVTNDHAIFTSYVDAGGHKTLVTIFDLHPAGGGNPQVVYQSSAPLVLNGAPHDITVSPDGQHAAVRSEFGVGYFRLDGPNSTRVWNDRPFGNPGPLGNAAMDTIEMTDDRIATISRWTDGTNFGAQVDVWTSAGDQRYRVLIGDPHDLEITPNDARLVVRTSNQVVLFDLQNLPPGDNIIPLSFATLLSTHTSYGAGLDSLAVTNDRVVAVARKNNKARVRFYDISADTLDEYQAFLMPDKPTDVAITPDESRVVIAGTTYAMACLMENGAPIFEHNPEDGGGFPWCDGVAVTNEHAAFFGYIYEGPPGSITNAGWYTLADLFRAPEEYCPATPNSSGSPAHIEAYGTASVGSNDFSMYVFDLPYLARGAFIYGDGQSNTPFGAGTLCVSGTTAIFGVQTIDTDGIASVQIDNTSLPGGTILPGTTWNFQFIFRDNAVPTTQTSDAVEVLFGN